MLFYCRRWTLITGHKSSVHTHLNYLVIVSPPFQPSMSSASVTVRNLVARGGTTAGEEITRLAVFDLENKFLAFSGTFAEGVREVISQWDQLFVLSNDGQVFLHTAQFHRAGIDIGFVASYLPAFVACHA